MESRNLYAAPFCLAVALCFGPGAVTAQTTQTNTVVDIDFENNTLYPVGNLQAVTDGAAVWAPASAGPGQIVSLGGASVYGKVLRRPQTGVDNTDYLSFPAISQGALSVSFDARASTAATRTLDVFLLPSSGGEVSLLGWGTVAGKLAYYDGAKWVGVFNLDTNWHRIEMINFLSGPSFGSWNLKCDDVLIATNLPWRNSYPEGTAFSRLRFGGIRGTAGTYAEMDNLVVTGEVTVPTPFKLHDPYSAAQQNFTFRFETDTNRDYLVETSAVLKPPTWQPLDIVKGQGATLTYTNQPATNPTQFFRVAKLPPPGYSDGYRGIWFTLGQFSTYGDKYSGGLGTYTADHIPVAIYAPAVNKTFFTYGGTIKDRRHLLIMASYYDHATHQVPRPVVVHDKQGVDDPHDNGAISIDSDGYLWVMVSGRANSRPGFIYRSRNPFDISCFDLIKQDIVTYPQPWHRPGSGFFFLFTKYTAGRELYWQTSPDGTNWSAHSKLAGIGGHYQVSNMRDGKIGSFFNRHPGGNVDYRTDLYYVQTTNWGTNWTTAAGLPLTVPLTTTNNPARVIDYSSQGKLMYTLDLNFDSEGNPVMLYITSNGWAPGPANAPRTWTITRWTGSQWITSTVCQSDHNYDMGSLYILPDRWLIIGPTQDGPQVWQTGGEMALWSSSDAGLNWTMVRQITTNSIYNHTYARRPLHAKDPFSVFWADGNSTNLSPSRLYFSNLEGTQVWQLPYDMEAATATPHVWQPGE